MCVFVCVCVCVCVCSEVHQKLSAALSHHVLCDVKDTLMTSDQKEGLKQEPGKECMKTLQRSRQLIKLI